jgi:hypothetical protein
MPLTGDFQKLDRWVKEIGKLDSPKLRFQVADEMADATLGLVAQEFSQERDPYGKPWAPKKRPDGRMILRGKSGRLIQFRKGTISPNGFRCDMGAPYGTFHQKGTRRMKARMMLPKNGKLPPRWAAVYREIYVRAMRSQLSAISGGGAGRSRTGSPRTRAA